MSNFSEEDLILYHYKELPEKQLIEIEEQLKSDQSLSLQYANLQKLFDTTKQFEPENIANNFEHQMWARVDNEIDLIEKNRTVPSQSAFSKLKDTLENFNIK